MTADPISLCFWICLQPERYVPGSPIFRESSPAPNATPTTTSPITAAPLAAGATAAAATTTNTTGNSPTNRSRGQAMTISLTHAAQGNSTTSHQHHQHHQHHNNNNNNSKAKPLPTCYISTRSAAMMALALGQHSSEKTTIATATQQQQQSNASCVKQQSQQSTSNSSNASPRTNHRSVSTSRPANRTTPNTATATATPAPSSMAITTTTKPTTTTTSNTTTTSRSTSKPSTPTAVRAAAQLNGMGILSGGSNSSGSDNDGFSTSGSTTATALRRLYFKSGRSIKNKINASTSASSPLNSLPMNAVSSAYHNSVSGATPMHPIGVPKLVVMGTSSASIPDTNINTSTDSACTLITNVTHTDTSETCDSLDLGDNSGPSEPLFSSLEEPLLTAIQIDSEHEAGGTELELTSCSRYSTRPDMNLQDSTEQSQESCLSILAGEPTSTTPLLLSSSSSSRQPSTAPPPTRGREHFTFDPPQSPKSARSSEKVRTHFTFKEDAQQVMEHRQQQGQQQGRRASSSPLYAGDEEAGAQEERAAVVNRNNKKLRARERGNDAMNANGSSSSTNTTRNRISPNISPSSSSRTSPKRERKRTTPSASTGAIAKINSAPPTMKDGNFFGSCQNQKQRQSQHQQHQQQQQQQLSPSSTGQQQQRKYSSSSSSGSSERCLREAAATGTMFPFDREALDYERIQRECFAPSSATASTSSDSDEAENRSVYERKLSADIFQQYSRLTQKEQQQMQQQLNHDRDHPPSRKNSKRIRPDSVIHTTIRENQQYVPQSDAFYPQAKSSSSPSDHSYAELNKFEDIANKFEQIPPKHGSNSTLNLHMLHMHSPGSESLHSASLSPTDSTRKRSFKSKSKSKAQAQALEDSLSSSGCVGSINVTANPLEAAAVCKQPRATIVVQQPSLSMDNTVETLLIKNEGDFISVEQGKELNARKRHSQQLAHPPHATAQQLQQHHHNQHQHQHHHHHQGQGQSAYTQQQQQQHKRDENMRQLLDVTNTLTIEELRDFEMRYGSPHHSRSQSVKMPGSRASGRPNQLCLPQQRSRVASMPNTGVEEEYYRLRHFSITGKGVVNRGDSLKSRRSRSNNSVASSNSSTEHLTAQQQQQQQQLQQQQLGQQQQLQQSQQQLSAHSSTSARTSLASSRESSTSNPGNGPYRVLMLGGPAVGKSSLVSQFMTSEYLHAYDTSIDLGNCDIRIHIEKAADDDESGEKAVSVLLSGEESELIFIDHGYTDMTPDECLTNYDPHGYCVIYSAADRSSFSIAEQVLQVLWTNQNIAQKAVILVSNKADLARSRLVTSEEGKAMATAYDCKFIETSVGINHNVDELLVGLLSQIRLKLENPEKSRDLFRKRSIRKSKRRACSPLSAGCLNANTPLGPLGDAAGTPPGSAQSSPRKYRGSRTSTSLKVKGLLGRVWTRDSKSKSCENLHVL